MRQQVFEGLSQFDYWLASDHINDAAAVISNPEMIVKLFWKYVYVLSLYRLISVDCFFTGLPDFKKLDRNCSKIVFI